MHTNHTSKRTPFIVTDYFQREELNRLTKEGAIEEGRQSSFIVVAAEDDSMAPQIMVGGAIVLKKIRPDVKDLGDCIGKPVAILSIHSQESFVLGRLQSVSNRYIRLSRDNPAFPARIISRRSVYFASLITYLLYMPPSDEL